MTDQIKVFTQSSILIKSSLGSIYIDPLHIPDSPHDASFILVTHDHYDHFSPDDIEKISNSDTVFIVPENMVEKANTVSCFVDQICTVMPDINTEINGLELETIPAYNRLKPFHPKSAGWVGYILNIDGNRIYIAGDTDVTPENKAVKCDIALVPIGGTYTMNAKKAAELINTIQPKVAIPTHYGSIVGKKEDAQVFGSLVKDSILVEYKLSF